MSRINAIAHDVAESEGLEIVDVQLLGGGSKRLLRVYIDKPEGVSHKDCEIVSHQLGNILDAEDVLPGGAYTLEVSSPGVERPLVRARDFARFMGKKAKVLLREPVENERRWEGVLRECSGDLITLESSAGKTIQFTLGNVERANLKFEW